MIDPEITFIALCDDNDRMHEVVVDLVHRHQTSYLEAMGYLLDRYEFLAVGMTEAARNSITLGRILAESAEGPRRHTTGGRAPDGGGEHDLHGPGGSVARRIGRSHLSWCHGPGVRSARGHFGWSRQIRRSHDR
jgi:hypothetical protein